MTERTFNLEIHDEGDGMLWAQVAELPGCFASGKDMNELFEAVTEAITMYIGEPGAVTSDAGSDAKPVSLSERRVSRLRRLGPDEGAADRRYHPRELRVALEA